MSAVIRRSERSPSFTSTLSAAAANERWALETLAGECLPELASFARLRGAADPDGIANVVMMEFFSRLPNLDFDAPAQMWAYLYSVARSRVIDERRATKPVDIIDVDSLDTFHIGQADFGDEVVDRHYVDRLLSSLTSDQREVLEMRFLDDLSIAETASRTGRTATAVKGLQRRAINALSTILVVVAIVGLAVLLLRDRDESKLVTVEPVTNNDVVESESPVLEVETGGDNGDESMPSDADDLTAPETSIVVTPEPSASSPTAAFEFTGSDEAGDVAGFECRLDGGAYDECSSPVEFDGLDEGGHVFEVRAVDEAGNVDLTSSLHVWVVGPESEEGADGDKGEGDQTAGEENSQTGAEGTKPVAAESAPPPVFKCGPVSGTRREIVKLGYDVTIGTKGDDIIDVSAGSKPDFVIGGNGNDSVITGNGDDVICGDGGNDSISSGGGEDRVFGGGGNDTINTGSDHDRAWGGGGNDTLIGSSGNDQLYGGDGTDIIEGRDGNDRLKGEDGFDVLIGGPGEDACEEGQAGARIESCAKPQP